MAPQHKVYDDINMIEAVLRDAGVDIEDAKTWHFLRAAKKKAIAASLAERSGATSNYCDFVIRDYFGQGRGTSQRAREGHQLRRETAFHVAARMYQLNVIGNVKACLRAVGIGPRTKAGKAILSALDDLLPDLPHEETSRLRLQEGVDAGKQFRALQQIFRRHGLGHLIPEQKLRVTKR